MAPLSGDPSPEAVAKELIAAFSAADLEAMRALMAPDLRAYITNAEGGEDAVGREEYLRRVAAMRPAEVDFSVELTQDPVVIDGELALIMVEVRARKPDRTLHNFAAHLLRVIGGAVTEWRMVEAKPAQSDQFWS